MRVDDFLTTHRALEDTHSNKNEVFCVAMVIMDKNMNEDMPMRDTDPCPENWNNDEVTLELVTCTAAKAKSQGFIKCKPVSPPYFLTIPKTLYDDFIRCEGKRGRLNRTTRYKYPLGHRATQLFVLTDEQVKT